MFSMCSELTPRARIPDTRIPQLMQPWLHIDTDPIFVIFLHKCTFWAQFFSTWKRVNCGKMSQNFPIRGEIFNFRTWKAEIFQHDRCGKIWNSPHMACVWCRKRRHICKIYAIYDVLLQNLLITLFCSKIYFAIIYALSCGEKLSPKVHLWRKND